MHISAYWKSSNQLIMLVSKDSFRFSESSVSQRRVNISKRVTDSHKIVSGCNGQRGSN